MTLKDTARHAVAARRARAYAKKTGYAGLNRLWSEEEDAILRSDYPAYRELARKLPGRTRTAICAHAARLKIQKKRHVWTGAEKMRLTKLYSRGASWSEISASFPFATISQIKGAIQTHNIHRPPHRAYAKTGIPIIDAIRDRCAELGYTMVDLDAMAHSGRFFAAASYRKCVGAKYILRAVKKLDGTLSVTWNQS